jgi:phosphoglycolate phosphatase
MARAAGVPVVIGYRAGWEQPPELEPGWPELHHWDELEAAAD